MVTIKCSFCDRYLSRAPVYLRHINGESLCNMCAINEDRTNLIRNMYYELIAKYLQFPCKYERYGCRQMIGFRGEGENENTHEGDCKYKVYKCPMKKIGQCEWEGPHHVLYLHFLYDHPQAVHENPCHFNHDIEASNICICLVPTCGELFLVQAEVQMPEGTIYHSVQYFGKNSVANDYKFDLFIQRNDTFIQRPGNVLPMQDMEVNEAISMKTEIDTLLEFLINYENTQFILTIHSVDDLSDDETEAFCHFCNKWRYVEQGICHSCRYELKWCTNKVNGCAHVNLFNKTEKHESLYCNYTNWCDFCEACIYDFKSKSHHYLTKHTTRELGAFVTINKTSGKFITILFRSEFGIIFCNYYLSNKKMELQISSSLLNIDIRQLQCKVCVEGPNTGHITEFILHHNAHSIYDWMLYLQKYNFVGWNHTFNIKIEIERY